jgi:hypothetical protein
VGRKDANMAVIASCCQQSGIEFVPVASADRLWMCELAYYESIRGIYNCAILQVSKQDTVSKERPYAEWSLDAEAIHPLKRWCLSMNFEAVSVTSSDGFQATL